MVILHLLLVKKINFLQYITIFKALRSALYSVSVDHLCSNGISMYKLKNATISLEMCYTQFFFISEFLNGLSQFSVKGDPKDKLRCMFHFI